MDQTQENSLNLYQKLAKIRSMTEVMEKNKSGYNYNYTSIDEILACVTAGMDKYGVVLVPMVYDEEPSVEPFTYTKKKYNKATRQQEEEQVLEYIYKAKMIYRWINVDNPTEYIDVNWFISGAQSDPSMAQGSAMTYGLRYHLMQFFQISALDNEDPDAWRTKQKRAADKEKIDACDSIIADVVKLGNLYVTNGGDANNLNRLVQKYTALCTGKPSKSPNDIDDPEFATQLLNEVKVLAADGGSNES